MILIKTPVNTWNPWNPVIKKKKLANNLFPYSFLTKLAPSTTYFVSAILFKDSSLDKTTFFFGIRKFVKIIYDNFYLG